MSEYEKLTVEAIGGGGAVEAVNHWLQKAIENALDPNTESGKKRVVTLRIEILPDETREKAVLSYRVDTKFPCDAPGADMVTISRQRKRGYVSAPQMSLDDMLDVRDVKEKIDEETGEVISLGKEATE